MATVNKDMTIREVLTLDPEVAPVFESFGMHCLYCPGASGESVERAAMAHGVSCEEILEKLNEFFDNKQ